MHHAHCKAAYRHEREALHLGNGQVTAVFENGEAGPHAHRHQQQMIVIRRQKEKIQEYRQELHGLLHRRGDKDGSPLPAEAVYLVDEAADIGRQQADAYSGDDRRDEAVRVPPYEDKCDQQRDCDADQHVLRVDHAALTCLCIAKYISTKDSVADRPPRR